MDEIVIKITFTKATGNVLVEGPLDQRLLFYGLLEIARDTCFDTYHNAVNRLVQPASIKLPSLP